MDAQDPDYIIDPTAHADVRQTALSWAVSTAKTGEPGEAVLARAEAYLVFILLPLRTDHVQAAAERNAVRRLH